VNLFLGEGEGDEDDDTNGVERNDGGDLSEKSEGEEAAAAAGGGGGEELLSSYALAGALNRSAAAQVSVAASAVDFTALANNTNPPNTSSSSSSSALSSSSLGLSKVDGLPLLSPAPAAPPSPQALLGIEVLARRIRRLTVETSSSSTASQAKQKEDAEDETTFSSDLVGEWIVIGAHALRLPSQQQFGDTFNALTTAHACSSVSPIQPQDVLANAFTAGISQGNCQEGAGGGASLPPSSSSSSSSSLSTDFSCISQHPLLVAAAGALLNLVYPPAPLHPSSFSFSSSLCTDGSNGNGASTLGDLASLFGLVVEAVVAADTQVSKDALNYYLLVNAAASAAAVKEASVESTEEEEADQDSAPAPFSPSPPPPPFEVKPSLLKAFRNRLGALGAVSAMECFDWGDSSGASLLSLSTGASISPLFGDREGVAIAVLKVVKTMATPRVWDVTPPMPSTDAASSASASMQQLRASSLLPALRFLRYSLSTYFDFSSSTPVSSSTSLSLPVTTLLPSVATCLLPFFSGPQLKNPTIKATFTRLPASVASGLDSWGKQWLLRHLQPCADVHILPPQPSSSSSSSASLQNHRKSRSKGRTMGLEEAEAAWLIVELLGGLVAGSVATAATATSSTVGQVSGHGGSSGGVYIRERPKRTHEKHGAGVKRPPTPMLKESDEKGDEGSGEENHQDGSSPPNKPSNKQQQRQKKSKKQPRQTRSISGSDGSSSSSSSRLTFDISSRGFDHHFSFSDVGAGRYFLALGEVATAGFGGDNDVDDDNDGCATTPLAFIPVQVLPAPAVESRKSGNKTSPRDDGAVEGCGSGDDEEEGSDAPAVDGQDGEVHDEKRRWLLVRDPEANPFFNPLLTSLVCPTTSCDDGGGGGVGGLEQEQTWKTMPLRLWAHSLFPPTAMNSSSKGKKQRHRHQPASTSFSLPPPPAYPRARLVFLPLACYSPNPPPRQSVLLHHAIWLKTSPAYARLHGQPFAAASSSPSIRIESVSGAGPGAAATAAPPTIASNRTQGIPSIDSGQDGASEQGRYEQQQQQQQQAEDAKEEEEEKDAISMDKTWRLKHPLQIGACDASQRRAVALGERDQRDAVVVKANG
jgi:hypothetical protein